MCSRSNPRYYPAVSLFLGIMMLAIKEKNGSKSGSHVTQHSLSGGLRVVAGPQANRT
jgi:hypothetical protein